MCVCVCDSSRQPFLLLLVFLFFFLCFYRVSERDCGSGERGEDGSSSGGETLGSEGSQQLLQPRALCRVLVGPNAVVVALFARQQLGHHAATGQREERGQRGRRQIERGHLARSAKHVLQKRHDENALIHGVLSHPHKYTSHTQTHTHKHSQN